MRPAEQESRHRPGHEADRKFRVHGLFRIPDLTDLPGVTAVDDVGTVEFGSAYFDTADLRLTREGITLRRRVVATASGAIESWHAADGDGWLLALPAAEAAGGHDDIRCPLDGRETPPDELTDLVRVVVRAAPLTAVSTLRTIRRRHVVRAAGHDVAEVIDDTVHVLDADGGVEARFRELALSDIDDGPLTESVAAALTDAGAVGGEFVAKVVRALGPAASAPAEVPEPKPAQAEEPAGQALVAHLARHVRALRAADIASRRDPSDPEAVHRLRVAARRLRSALRTFRPLVDIPWSKQLRTELAWFARGLGDLRESEVLRERLIRHCDELGDTWPSDDVRVLLADALGERIAAAQSRVRTLMNSARYVDLHESLVEAVREPLLTSAADVPGHDALPPLVARAWKRLAEAGAALGDDSPDERWHAVRLEAKRTRYAAEAVAPALGPDAAAFAKRIEKLTDILGEHQDAVQAAATAQSLAGSAPATPLVADALEALGADERARALAARRRFAAAWSKARRPGRRRWLPS